MFKVLITTILAFGVISAENPVFLTAKVEAKLDCASIVENQLLALVAATHEEPGCIVYACHRDQENPNVFIFIERWASKEDLDQHFASGHFNQCLLAIMPYLIEGPLLTHLEPLSQGPKGQF